MSQHPRAKRLDRLDTDGVTYWYIKGVRRLYNQGKQGHGRRGPDGAVVGPAEKMSLPYNSAGETYVYSDRWLASCLKER